MASPINLNPDIGIQSILVPDERTHMPSSQPLPATAIRETGLNELYSVSNTDKILEQALCPKVGDGTILKPAVFNDCLKNAFAILQDNPQPAVQSFVRNELGPLLENESLLRAYSGLLIGG